MELAGGGGFAVGRGDGRVGEHGVEQQFEVGVGEAVDVGQKLAPEGGDIVGGGGQKVGFIHLAGLGHAQLVDLHLQPVVKAGGRAAGLDDVALFEDFGDARVAQFPDAAFKLAGFVAQNQVQVGFVGLGHALLFEQNKKKAVEGFSVFKEG